MCSIDKMLIKGIRSFSPDNTAVVEFHKPLTLIVGQNGAGKTTIIECLKHCCTGDLPPNVKSGQNFVHDPQIAYGSEVKAQIKLRVFTPSGQPFIITRSMQVTQKKVKKEFKSLDSALMVVDKNTGKQETMSYRCADLDKIIPGMMGVSKAILENVIFVHQEDSFWPLLESSTLKKKFDDIFAASKYTKGVQEIKDLCKEKTQLGRELKLQVQNLKLLVDNYQKLKEDTSVAEEKERSMTELIQQLDGDIQKHNNIIAELEDKCKRLGTLGEQMIQLQTRKLEVQGQTESYLSQLGEAGDSEDTTEQLQLWQQKFEDQMGQVQSEKQRIQNDIQQKNVSVQQVSSSQDQLIQMQGRLLAERASYEQNLEDLQEFIRRISGQLGINISGSLSPEQVRQFENDLRTKLSKLRDDLERMKNEHRRMAQTANEELNKVVNERAGIDDKVRMRKEQLRQNEIKMRDLQSEISQSTVGQQLVEDYKEQVRDAQQAMAQKNQEFQDQNLEVVIQQEAEQINELDRQLSKLRQEQSQAATASEGSTRLRMKKQELMGKEQQMQNLLQSWSSQLKTTLGVDRVPALGEIRGRIESALNAKQQEQQQLNQKVRQSAAIDSQLEGQLSRARQRLDGQTQELQRMNFEIQAGMKRALNVNNAPPNESFEQVFQEKESKQQDNINSCVKSNAIIQLAGQYKVSGEQHNSCPICLRGFNNENEKKVFMDHMDQQLATLPERLKKIEERKLRYEQQLQGLKALQPLWLKCMDLKNVDIPASMDEISKLESQKQESADKTAMLDEEALILEVEIKKIQTMFNEVALPATKLSQEIEASQSQLRDLEATVRVSGGGTVGSRSVADIVDEVDRVERLRRKHHDNREEAQRKLQRLKDDLAQLNIRWREVNQELQTVEYQAKRQEELKKQLEQLNNESDRLRGEITQLERSVMPLGRKEQQLRQEQVQARETSESKEYNLDSQIREFQQIADQLKHKYEGVRTYEEADKSGELSKVERNLNQCRQNKEELQQQINKLTEEYQNISKKIDDKEKVKREIEDCLRYRNSKQLLEQVDSEIQKLEARMQEIGDLQSLLDSVKDAKSEREVQTGQLNMLKGSVNTIKEEIQQNRTSMKHPQFADVEKRHLKQILEEKANEMSVKDLEKYYQGVEKALLQYHIEKMAGINRIIRELWVKTYKGNDIDYIEIKADQESRGKAAYTYRVVMHVLGAQLDMRGRCSTGQKVLACLIIRLALAETFCMNCGVLALDEPTTNLDSANSQSLATELRNIIESRRSQESFQLVVITHDKKFAEQISGRNDYCDTMWQVTKDSSGYSRLAKVPIN